MINHLKSEKQTLKVVSPVVMKRNVPSNEIAMSYDWQKQRSTDAMKFRTMGTTNNTTPGSMFRDMDSWSD